VNLPMAELARCVLEFIALRFFIFVDFAGQLILLTIFTL